MKYIVLLYLAYILHTEYMYNLFITYNGEEP